MIILFLQHPRNASMSAGLPIANHLLAAFWADFPNLDLPARSSGLLFMIQNTAVYPPAMAIDKIGKLVMSKLLCSLHVYSLG